MAAGTITQALTNLGSTGAKVLTFTCTASADAATYPSTDTSTEITAAILGMCIAEVRTNPGGTAPTAAYDIVINDTDGIDLMGGALANRSATASERVVPALNAVGTYGSTLIDGTLTLVITNNAVNSAGIVVKVFLTR